MAPEISMFRKMCSMLMGIAMGCGIAGYFVGDDIHVTATQFPYDRDYFRGLALEELRLRVAALG